LLLDVTAYVTFSTDIFILEEPYVRDIFISISRVQYAGIRYDGWLQASHIVVVLVVL
jgi:hypothetical protein